MKEDTRKVLTTLIPVVTEARTTSDAWYSVRIMPYRTTDDRIDGLVITFSDITVAKKLEFKLKENVSSNREKK
jgi:two-component system CheB/CheR fusion protein